jgi:SAM-dependent methyltransferase
VLTAPMPTRRMPSFPVASAIFGGFFTTGDYITRMKGPAATRSTPPCNSSVAAPADNVSMRWFRKPVGDPLTVSMAGLKLGDRLLILGSSDIPLAAALAGKVGLTGRACLVDESADRLTAAAAAVEREGALVESFTAPMSALPFDVSSFDVVVARNVLPAIPAATRAALVAEVTRVVRAGGRCIVIDDLPRGGFGGVGRLPGGRTGEPSHGATAVALLTTGGFRGVRTLAEREGFVFVEGVKAGDAPV